MLLQGGPVWRSPSFVIHHISSLCNQNNSSKAELPSSISVRDQLSIRCQHGLPYRFKIVHMNTLVEIMRRIWQTFWMGVTFGFREALNKKHSFCLWSIFRPFLRQIRADTTSYSRYSTVFLLLFLKKGQTSPCIRLRRVFARPWQVHTNWHKRT